MDYRRSPRQEDSPLGWPIVHYCAAKGIYWKCRSYRPGQPTIFKHLSQSDQDNRCRELKGVVKGAVLHRPCITGCSPSCQSCWMSNIAEERKNGQYNWHIMKKRVTGRYTFLQSSCLTALYEL